jgi:hypothetical protein
LHAFFLGAGFEPPQLLHIGHERVRVL